MKIYNHICKCGCPMTAIIELDKQASGGYAVRFMHELGILTGIAALGPMSSRPCPVCKRNVVTDFNNGHWKLLEPIETTKGARGNARK